jgi:hypothetical protein
VASQLRLGKSVKVRVLGTFTFCRSAFDVAGMTESEGRNSQRELAFILSRGFCPELALKAGVFRDSRALPLAGQEDHSLPSQQVNWVTCAQKAELPVH